jgi:hypothetical protein
MDGEDRYSACAIMSLRYYEPGFCIPPLAHTSFTKRRSSEFRIPSPLHSMLGVLL